MFFYASPGSYNQAGQGESQEVTQLSHWGSLPETSTEFFKEATPWIQSLNVGTGTNTTCQSSELQLLEKQQEHTQTLPTRENHPRHLSELMEAGVLPRRSTLRLFLKVRVKPSRLNFKIMSYCSFTIKRHKTGVWLKVHCCHSKLNRPLFDPAGSSAQCLCHG